MFEPTSRKNPGVLDKTIPRQVSSLTSRCSCRNPVAYLFFLEGKSRTRSGGAREHKPLRKNAYAQGVFAVCTCGADDTRVGAPPVGAARTARSGRRGVYA